MRTKPSARKIWSAWPGFQPSAASRAGVSSTSPARSGAAARASASSCSSASTGAAIPATARRPRRLRASGAGAGWGRGLSLSVGGRQRGAASSAKTAPIACASGSSRAGQVERKGAEADAETLQDPPLVPAQRADMLVGMAPVENAGLLDELIGDAAREAPQASVCDRLGQALERGEPPARFARDEGLEPPGGALARGVLAEIADQPDARLERTAADDFARRKPAPFDAAARREREGLVALARELAEPAGDLRRDRPFDGPAQGAVLQGRGASLGLEMDARKPADDMAFDGHRAVGADPAEDGAGALVQRPEERAGAPVDEALHERRVQRVGKPVLEIAGAALPRERIGEPVGAVGDIGERAHAREPHRQGVDVAVRPVERGDLALHPVVRHAPVSLRQMLEQAADQARVLLLRRLAEVRRLAGLPQPPQIGPVARAADDRFVRSTIAAASFRPGPPPRGASPSPAARRRATA